MEGFGKRKALLVTKFRSSAIGETIYILFVVSLVNVGMVSFAEFLQILIVSYSYKFVFDLAAVGPASLAARFLKQIERSRCGVGILLSAA